MITKRRICAGNYQYRTPMGNLALSSHIDGWTFAQYTPESGTVDYGTYPTQRDAEAALAELFA